MSNPELLAYLTDGASPLEHALASWLASKRWEAFATAHRDKIRKKLRETRDVTALDDLRAELETAYLLLREPRFGVVYEPFGRGRGPAPDYAVQFTTSSSFMLEVTHLRDHERLGDVVAAKLRQLVPDYPNALLVWLAEAPESGFDLRGAALRLRQRAEAGDAALFERRRFVDRADFFRHWGRLSELLVLPPGTWGVPLQHWTNPAAQRPLPARILTALLESLATG